METILIILLIYLIFRDVFKEDIENFRYRKARKEEQEDKALEEKRNKDLKEEFNNMMGYSIEQAIESKRGDVDGK